MRINKDKLFTVVAITLGIAFIFLLWWILAASINNVFFPDPNKTFARMFLLLGEGDTWIGIGATLLRLLISFIICLLISIILGLIAGRFDYFAKFLNPLVSVLRTLPTAAIIFTLVVLMKPDFALQIILFLMMFPIIYQAVVNGFKTIDPSIIRAIKMEMNVMSFESIFKIIIPYSWHSIILGAIQSLGLGMKASIMAEVLVGNNEVYGIGRILYYGYISYEMDKVFAISVIAVIIIGGLDILLNRLKKRYNKETKY